MTLIFYFVSENGSKLRYIVVKGKINTENCLHKAPANYVSVGKEKQRGHNLK